MDYRTGKCSQCGAEYKVPASFAHSAARCKQCKGVVHLGPPQGAAPASAAAAPAAMPAKRVVPKPAAPSAPRPATPELAKGPPAAPSARPPAPKSEPAPVEKGGALERLRAERTGASPTPTPTPAAPQQAAPATPVRAGSARKADEEDEDSGSKRGARRGAKERTAKQKAPMGGILSAVGLVVVAVVAVLFRDTLFGGGGAAETDPAAVNAGDASATAASRDAGTATTPAETATAMVDAPGGTPDESREAAPAEPAKKPEPKVKDPASIDLAAIADFGPTSDTTAEEWAEMQELIGQWMDIDAGAAGNRARLKLMELKRKAVPAILNHFKKLDFATKEGRSNGDQCQKALEKIWNGTNFDWRYPDDAAGKPVTDPNDVWFCKRATELWCSLWKQAEENIEVWIQKAKLEEKDPDEARRLREVFGKPGEASTSGGDEDLEVD